MLDNLFETQWYALQTKPNFERQVALRLREKNVETVVPAQTEPPGPKKERRPSPLIFPDYVFCRVNLLRGPRLIGTPGVIRIVGAGKTPIAISEEEMRRVRLLMDSGLHVFSLPYFKIGDWVEIRQGPLTGASGILLNVCGDSQLVVSIELLQRSMAVRINPRWAAPMQKYWVYGKREIYMQGDRCA
jgi:transcription antitermination factor NusG